MSFAGRVGRFGLPLLALGALVAAVQAPQYHVTQRYVLGGDGGWDYIALDRVGHRLFIARQDRVMVVDPASGRLLGDISGLNRAHGVAFDNASGRGFASSGADSTVTMFDLKTLRVLGRIPVAVDDDAILYDPATKHVFTMNGDAGSASVIDPVAAKNIGTIPLGGKPEFGVTAANGKLYANIEDRSEVVEIDAAGMKVLRRWPIAPCESPSGLAIDLAHHRLFSVCRNKLMGVSDIVAGKLVATVPIGAGVDAARFDPATADAFASNGEGTLTVVHQDTPDSYTVAQTVQTMPGARTMELDPATHLVYTVSAEFGPQPAPVPGQRRGRPPVVPGTFALLVLGR